MNTWRLPPTSCSAMRMVSSLPPPSRVKSDRPPTSPSTRPERLRRLSTSAYRLAVSPKARHSATSASWDTCSGTISTCPRVRQSRFIVSRIRSDFPVPARPIQSCSIRLYLPVFSYFRLYHSTGPTANICSYIFPALSGVKPLDIGGKNPYNKKAMKKRGVAKLGIAHGSGP